jgi:hypothetical protein
MMRRLVEAAVLALALSLTSAAPASAGTAALDFEEFCAAASNCDGAAIDSSFVGGLKNVSIFYGSRGTGATEALEEYSLRFAKSGFATLSNVAYGGIVNSVASILLLPDEGYSVRLGGFDLASLNGVVRETAYSIFGGDDGKGGAFEVVNPRVTLGGSSIDAVGSVLKVRGDWTSEAGITIEWGPDAQSVGLDNMVIWVEPVPGPIAGAGLPALLAVAGFAAWRQRRRRTQFGVRVGL